MTRDEALAVVDCFYAAALAEASWQEALTLLADGFRGSAATVEVHDSAAAGLASFEGVRVDPDSIDVYARDYAASNPRVNFLRHTDAALAFDHLFITDDEIDRDPYYSDFLAPLGLRYFIWRIRRSSTVAPRPPWRCSFRAEPAARTWSAWRCSVRFSRISAGR